MSFEPDNVPPAGPAAKIKVIGVGGGGGNAVNTMIRSSLEGVDFITVNTDVQALRFSLASSKLQVGKALTRGLGAGADPDIGRDAALEDRQEIQEVLTGADMVFITAGMGGGTGTGGAAVVAQIARELGALTVAVVTKPFAFEGKRRRKHAELGIARLRECVDTLITIPNQRLLQVASPSLSMIDAFKMADDVLVNAVRGISDIINVPGRINVDFADVKTIMSCMGQALMGIGAASGEDRAAKAARMAICSPLLEDVDIEGATGILINITAGSSVGLMEVSEACSIVQDAAHEDANIIFGAVIDESLGDLMRVTVIATGFPVDKDEIDAVASSLVKPPAPPVSPFASRLTIPAGLVGSPKPQPAARPATPSPEPAEMAPQAERKLASVAPSPEPAAPRAQISSPFDEAQELARWTLDSEDETAQETPGHEDLSFLANEPRVLAADELLADHTVHEQGLSNEPQILTELASSDSEGEGEIRAEAVDSSLASDSDADFFLAPQESVAPRSSDHRPGAVAEASTFASIFDVKGGLMATDIDRKIDEALELAERMRAPRKTQTDDDLDVPAFLRSGMKDLPLE